MQSLIARDPFQPFRIQLASGAAYDVRNPGVVVAMNRELFLALPGGER